VFRKIRKPTKMYPTPGLLQHENWQAVQTGKKEKKPRKYILYGKGVGGTRKSLRVPLGPQSLFFAKMVERVLEVVGRIGFRGGLPTKKGKNHAKHAKSLVPFRQGREQNPIRRS